MTVRFHWLGTGASLNPTLGNTSCCVDAGGARTLLVDCGATVFPKMVELDITGRITDVVLTHHHADHIGGLEAYAFYSYFVLQQRGDKRPVLHMATDEFAHTLWEKSLRAGMEHAFDHEGEVFFPTLETFFRISIGTHVKIPEVCSIDMLPTPHVTGMENYALRFGNDAFYSGDSTDLPPHDPGIIFQDCRFGDADPNEVHISYDTLNRELPADVKAKTHLLHLGIGHEQYEPQRDGFAGFVMPGQEFHIDWTSSR